MEHTNLIKEFYHAIAFLLKYQSNEETAKVEKRVLDLLCRVHDRQESADDIWKHIEAARCVEVASDSAWLKALPSYDYDIAVPPKLSVLQARRIEILKPYAPAFFADELKEMADEGDPDACKLLAYLSFLGCVLPANCQVAKKILSTLAANGDFEAISVLIYTYEQEKEPNEAARWRVILRILKTEYEAFSSFALPSKYSDCAPEDVQFANLILFIKQKNAKGAEKLLDRSMLHYVLESKENCEYKMERISTGGNYYLIMKAEDRHAGKKFGF